MTDESHARAELNLWQDESLVWSEGPDPRGAIAARMRYASHKAHEAMQESLAVGNIAGVILSPFVASFVWLRQFWQREISYTITTRRILTSYGSDLNWRAIDQCLAPKVLWRNGEVGSVLFCHDSDREPGLRFDGIRDPDGVIALVLQTAGLPSTRDPQVSN